MQVASSYSAPDALPVTSCPTEFLVELARFFDESERALSFYFDSSSLTDISHRQELIHLENLIDAVGSHVQADGELRDLKFVQSMTNEIMLRPRVFRAAFLSGSHGIRKQLELPIGCDIGMLEEGRRFRLAPLLRALEACTPYGVVLVENGKARVFSVRGEDIHEWTNLVPPEDVAVHAESHRGSWPSHVEANAEDRARKFLRNVVAKVHQLAVTDGLEYIVTGCREDLWSRLEPEFVAVSLPQVRSFHIQNFSASDFQVLEAAQPVFQALRKESYKVFWSAVEEEPERGAKGIRDVSERLNEGRVRQLFLGNGPFGEVLECGRCGSGLPVQDTHCPSCTGAPVYLEPLDEWMIRRAILSGARVIAEPIDQPRNIPAVGALLRY